MSFLDLVKHRRSVRDFLDRPVEREKVMVCLEAARLAPSAGNSQPWRFIVVDDAEVKRKLGESAFGGIYALNSFCKRAPVIVAVVSEKSHFLARLGQTLQGTKYYLVDIGIAGQHFVLQAEELGLGTCWIGWFNEKAVKSVLHVSREKKVDILIALGYYDAGKVRPAHTRHGMDKVASFNSY